MAKRKSDENGSRMLRAPAEVLYAELEVTDAEADCPANPKPPARLIPEADLGADCEGQKRSAISEEDVCP